MARTTKKHFDMVVNHLEKAKVSCLIPIIMNEKKAKQQIMGVKYTEIDGVGYANGTPLPAHIAMKLRHILA